MRKFYMGMLVFVIGMFAHAQEVQLDPTFGEEGLAITEIGYPINEINATVVQADGKVLVAGSVGAPNKLEMGVARFDADGALDPTFGDGGKKVIAVGDDKSFIVAMQLQADGKIILGGYTWNADFVGDFVAVRLNVDGSLDSTFGTEGIAIIDNGRTEVPSSMALLDDGKIILAGYVDDLFGMAKLNEDGTIDASFGSNGWVVTPNQNGGFGYVNDITVQEDGKILLAGMTMNGSNSYYDLTVDRYLADGQADTDFADNGRFLANISGDNDFATALGVQSDGKIVIGGHTFVAGWPIMQYDALTFRLNVDGTIDTSYGDNGYARIQFVDEGENYISRLAIQADDQIVLAGNTTELETVRRGYAARLTKEGELDDTFGIEGYGVIAYGNNIVETNAVALGENGDIIAAGNIYDENYDMTAYAAKFISVDMGVDHHNAPKVKLYPNPASDFISVSGIGTAKNAQLELVNLTGQTVRSVVLQEGNQMDITNLASGVYLVKIVVEGKVTTTKLVKE